MDLFNCKIIEMGNRIIKFRAWNGKYMVDASYGDWVCFDGTPYTEASKKYNTPNIEIEKEKSYVIMQFTGLLDKNGNEIYEGDIIKVGSFIPDGIIVFNNEVPSFQYAYKAHGKGSGIGGRMNNNLYKSSQTEYEIIGNIYGHPHLLTNPTP